MNTIQETLVTTLRSIKPPLCVLSTVDATGKSESAVMAYAVQDDGTLLISTHTVSRKWKNMQTNNQVSLVFGLSFGVMNVQVEGTATLFSEGADFEANQKIFFDANPELMKYRTNDTGFIQVKPNWVRLNDYTQAPPKVEESSL